MAPKLLTVFGATGNQGGAVINTILANSTLSQQFCLRGITRNTSSAKAKDLAARGVEVVAADLNDSTSLEEALRDSYAVFAVTNYWETQSRATEVAQGKAIADACVLVGVKHAVWSSLPNVTRLSEGRLTHVQHFDGKSEIGEYFDKVKRPVNMVTTFFSPGFYMSNFKDMVRSDPNVNDDVLTLSMPWDLHDTHIPLLDAAKDTGAFVAGIITYPDPSELDGKTIQAVSEWSTPARVVEDLSNALGKEVRFESVSDELFLANTPGPVAEELTENMVLIRDFSYYGRGAVSKQGESNKVLAHAGLKTTRLIEFLRNSVLDEK